MSAPSDRDTADVCRQVAWLRVHRSYSIAHNCADTIEADTALIRKLKAENAELRKRVGDDDSTNYECPECGRLNHKPLHCLNCGHVPDDARDGWHEVVAKLSEDLDLDISIIVLIFNALIPHWSRDPTQTHLWIALDDLFASNDYGVPCSKFYSCKLCGVESGAGLLNKGIPHLASCPLHDTNLATSRSDSAPKGEPS